MKLKPKQKQATVKYPSMVEYKKKPFARIALAASLAAAIPTFTGCLIPGVVMPAKGPEGLPRPESEVADNKDVFIIDIQQGPSLDAGPNTYRGDRKVIDGVPLLTWLGGAGNIKRILIGTPHANTNQQKLTEEYVRGRFDKAVCVNSKANEWHYAPYTMGTIYMNDGTKINYEMYLSGIKVGKVLFAQEGTK